jgi:glycosyltransferase involved in cell wall biosynthesis
VRIVHAIARLNMGGAALSVVELAAAQRRRGHDVLLVAGTIPSGEDSMEYLADAFDVPHLHIASLQREISPRADLHAVSELRRLLRDRRPDVLHTHTSKAGATGRVAAMLAGGGRPRATVHTFHGHVLSGYFPPGREHMFRVIERTLAFATDALVAVSDEVRDDLVRMQVAPRSKFVVIPYGFDLDRRVDTRSETRDRMRAEAAVDAETLVVGFVGRLTPIKRPEDLVRTVAAMESRAVRVVIGDGDERTAAERLGVELGVADRCRFLGYRRDVAEWYAAFDTLLLTSANEGSPVVAIEALAAGRPVVATAAGGTGTVVDDGETGFLLPVGDVHALAASLDRLAREPELREQMGALGARRMRERFTTERMADDVERLYARLIRT